MSEEPGTENGDTSPADGHPGENDAPRGFAPPAPEAPPMWTAPAQSPLPPMPPYTPYGSAPYGSAPYGSAPYGYGSGAGAGAPPVGAPPGWPWSVPGPVVAPSRGHTFAAVAVALGVLIAAIGGGIVGHAIWKSAASSPLPTNSSTGPGAAQGSPAAGSPQDAASIANNVSPGLVDINVEISSQGLQGAGTGIVLTSNGEVMTNNHVVEGATRISVTDIGNGNTYGATVLGYDRTHDVAVLQLTGASGLQTVHLGDSSKLKVGQGVVAIGNAGGQGGTPSYAGGSITALNQTITASDEADGSSEQLTGLIETNADVQSGDSGGPLVNSSGHVIGMDTAASSGYSFQTSGNSGFAIPINAAINVAKAIVAGNASSTIHVGPTALLGVEVRSNTSSSGGFGQYGGSSVTAPGALVLGLVAGGPAANAGLVAGDVITALDGQAVNSAPALTTVMLGEKPGNKVSVQYLDQSGQHTVQVVLVSGPAQ